MKRILFTHIFPALIAISVIAISLSGCMGAEDVPAATNKAVTVTFSVVTPRPNHAANNSRATWGDPYLSDAGNDFDNLLLSDQLRVLITDNSCTKEIAMTNLLCTGATENDSEVSYDFIGRIAPAYINGLKSLTDGKLHIIANAGTSARLADDTEFVTASNQPDDSFTGIPMWGVKTVDFSRLQQNERFDAGKVELLRAIAKVEIVIGTDIPDKQENTNFIAAIRSATVNRLNTTGYLLPTGWAEAKETKDVTKGPETPRTVHTPVGPCLFNPSDDRKSVTFYLPECLNTAENELYISLNYESAAGTAETDDIYFCNYNNSGKPDRENKYDIRRNHLYRFIVRRNGNEIAVSADVVPYESVDLDPGFGLTPPEDSKD